MCIKLDWLASRTRGSADGYWSGHKAGLDPGETRGSESWLPEGPGGPCQLLERPWRLEWATEGVIDLNQPVKHVLHVCKCLCMRQQGDQGQLLNKLSMQGWLLEGSVVCRGMCVHVHACRLKY